ncbi:MAG: hypothetical protein E6K54_07355 [Gammaproteobacteria bacterium]|nr:MAG: hypothetical protein E6K54_07355 [Gammaproteobacteria bacterium]
MSISKKISKESKEKLKKDTIRMNINVPRVFYKEIQHKALDEDISVTEFVIRAIKNFMEKRS